MVAAVLDALSAPAGAEDTRSQAQRYHDALHEAMQRLVTAGLLPERAGQPVKAWVHISLRRPDGPGRQLGAAGGVDRRVRAQWAAHRAEASAGGSDGGAWLDGDAAQAVACDAAMAPIVTGEVNPAALEDLVRLCVQLDRLRHHGTGRRSAATRRRAPAPDTTLAWEALEQAIIGKAVDLLSGPGGLASFLRRRQLGARLGGPSLPLDIGYSRDHPGRDPQRGHPARPALPVGRPVQPARQRRARCTMSSTRRTAARPASETVFYCAGFTTRS